MATYPTFDLYLNGAHVSGLCGAEDIMGRMCERVGVVFATDWTESKNDVWHGRPGAPFLELDGGNGAKNKKNLFP